MGVGGPKIQREGHVLGTRSGPACPCDGNGVCPHASLLVLLLIARSSQKRSRRDLALLCVFLETVNAASGKTNTYCISGFAEL